MQEIKNKLYQVCWLVLLLLPFMVKAQELVVTPTVVIDCDDPDAVATVAPDEGGSLLLIVGNVKAGYVVTASWKQGAGASRPIPGTTTGSTFAGEAFTPAPTDEAVCVSVSLSPSQTALFRLTVDGGEAAFAVLAAGVPTDATSFVAGTRLTVTASGRPDRIPAVSVQRIEGRSADERLILSSANVSAGGVVSVSFDMPSSDMHIQVLTITSIPDPAPEPDPDPDQPTAVETPSAASSPHAAGAVGELILSSPTAVKADVYSIGGHPVIRGKTVDGSCRISLGAGLYLVRFDGGRNFKVIIR